MPRKKLRQIHHWRKERSNRRRAGLLNPAAPNAFRRRRNKRENKHTIIAEQVAELPPSRQGGQWHGQVTIADDFDEMPADFMRNFE